MCSVIKVTVYNNEYCITTADLESDPDFSPR